MTDSQLDLARQTSLRRLALSRGFPVHPTRSHKGRGVDVPDPEHSDHELQGGDEEMARACDDPSRYSMWASMGLVADAGNTVLDLLR